MEDNFNKHLGSKLKLRRLALGLTQTKVAKACLLYTSPSPRDLYRSRMPSSA